MTDMQWRDRPAGYGRITRLLHWGMAALLLWQFTSALLRQFAADTPVEGFLWSTHFSIGFTLWLLVLVRGIWGLANLRRRPPHDGAAVLRAAATAGHLAMYVLMNAVPMLAILRAANNGRGFSVYGIELVAPGGNPVPALTAPANAAHGLLGWVLLALIGGHVVMALWHGLVRRDGTLGSMMRGTA